MGKRYKARLKRSLNPMVVLDYRCYTEGGTIGTNYPPELKQCLASLTKMTASEIQKKCAAAASAHCVAASSSTTRIGPRSCHEQQRLRRLYLVSRVMGRVPWGQGICHVRRAHQDSTPNTTPQVRRPAPTQR